MQGVTIAPLRPPDAIPTACFVPPEKHRCCASGHNLMIRLPWFNTVAAFKNYNVSDSSSLPESNLKVQMLPIVAWIVVVRQRLAFEIDGFLQPTQQVRDGK
jgi:hypothetical protein